MDVIRTTLCLLMVLSMSSIEGRINPRVTTSLQKIKTSLASAGKNVKGKVDKISNYLNSEKGNSQVEILSSSIETIGEAVSSLTSDDAAMIVSGTLDVISAATTLIPKYGSIISTVFSLFGTIFGAIAGDGNEDVGTVVRREIEKALKKYDDSELRAEASGAIRVFVISHAYLAAIDDKIIKEHELSALSANVPIYQGIGFLGKLEHKVKENSKSNDPYQVKRAMEYLQLYVTLAVLRSSILWEMYAIVRASSHSSPAGIQGVINAEDENDKNFLNFLLEPDYQQAVFFAYFNPSEWPQIMQFMEKKGLRFQQLNHLTYGTHYLSPERWQNWYMYMTNDAIGTMAGTKELDDQSRFYFEAISIEDNLFYLRSKKWLSWYVFMQNDQNGHCRGWKGRPGPSGEWKVIKFKDRKYMLSPRKWPNWFIYMGSDARGHIRGWKGDPGKQGHWLIN